MTRHRRFRGLRIETGVMVAGGTARDDRGAVCLFFGASRLAMTLCLRAWVRSAASFRQGAAIQGRDEAGLGALGDAIAGLTGLLMDMAARAEAMVAMVVDGRARWTVGVYLRATESELTGRGMLRAAAIGRRGAGMREAVAEDVMATDELLRMCKIER